MTNEEAIEILQEEHDWVQEPSYVINAIEKAIAALRSLDAVEPLTLEQLREAWKPCDGCMSCSNCDDAMQKDDDYPCCECIDSKAPNGLFQASMKYFQATGYCRHCGRPLTPEAWAELGKRLRG